MSNNTQSTEQLTLTPHEAMVTILTCAIHNPKVNILLEGAPGCGKSSIVRQAVDLLNTGGTIRDGSTTMTVPVKKTDLVYYHLPTSAPEDWGGILCTFEREGNTLARKVPMEELTQLFNPENHVIAMMDDFGPAPASVQATVMQPIQDRVLGDFKIHPDKVQFVIATNRREDKSGVGGVIEAVRDRCVTYPVAFDLDSWSDYAITSGLFREDAIAHARWHEQYLPQHTVQDPCTLNQWRPSRDGDKCPTPRGVQRMSDMLNMGLNKFLDLAGCVGSGWAKSFMGFQTWADKMPDIDLMLRSPESAPVPVEPAILYMLTTGLLFRVQKDLAVAPKVVTYLERMKAKGTTGIETPLICRFLHDLDNLPNHEQAMEAFMPLHIKFQKELTGTAL